MANCAVELIYRARGHEETEPFGSQLRRRWAPRLYWLLDGVLADIRDIGFTTCVGGDCRLAKDLKSLVRENELIDWKNVWPNNRNLPIRNSDQTPVFESGGYVAFNAQDFEIQMPDGVYLEEEVDDNGKGLGLAVDGSSNKEERLIGSFRHHEHQFANRPRRKDEESSCRAIVDP